MIFGFSSDKSKLLWRYFISSKVRAIFVVSSENNFIPMLLSIFMPWTRTCWSFLWFQINNDPFWLFFLFFFHSVNLQESGGKRRCDFESFRLFIVLYCCLSHVQKLDYCCFLSDCVSTLLLPHENNFDKIKHISPFFFILRHDAIQCTSI